MNPHGIPLDPKSSASASSATLATILHYAICPAYASLRRISQAWALSCAPLAGTPITSFCKTPYSAMRPGMHSERSASLPSDIWHLRTLRYLYRCARWSAPALARYVRACRPLLRRQRYGLSSIPACGAHLSSRTEPNTCKAASQPFFNKVHDAAGAASRHKARVYTPECQQQTRVQKACTIPTAGGFAIKPGHQDTAPLINPSQLRIIASPPRLHQRQ